MTAKFVRRLVSGGFLLLAIPPATAATASPACKTVANDVAKIVAHGETSDSPDLDVTAGPNSCVFSNLSINLTRNASWTIDRLSVASPDIQSGFTKGPPTSLRVDATGIRFALRVGDSHARYLTSVLQTPFNIRLHYDWDQRGDLLQVHEITLESPWIGRASLAMDLDLPLEPDISHLNARDIDPGIRRIHFVLDNRAIVESMMMPLLVSLIPSDKDPAIEFPKIQKKAERLVRKLPDTRADDASKDALARFVRDFPHPSGHFEETLTFDPPLRLDDLLSDKKAKWLRSAHVQAAYQPLPPAPAPAPAP